MTAVRGRIEELVDICDGVIMFAMFALFEEMSCRKLLLLEKCENMSASALC